MMKKLFLSLSAIAITCFILTSCSKNDSDSNPNPEPEPDVQHLLSAIAYTPTDSLVYNFSYDANGKLTRISVKSSYQTTPTFYLISYEPNQITLTYADSNTPGLSVNVKVLFMLNSNNTVAKRIVAVNLEHSGNIPTHTYNYDTTIYQYNSQGMRIGGITNEYDSTAYDQTSPKSNVSIKTGSLTNTITGNNLVESRELINQIDIIHNSTNTNTYISGSETIKTFDYSAAYPNKTDFTNSIVLNEVNIISLLPIAEEWKNLPNKAVSIFNSKNASGAVTNTITTESSYEYTYNSDGLVASRKDPKSPSYVVKYVYGK